MKVPLTSLLIELFRKPTKIGQKLGIKSKVNVFNVTFID